MLEAPCPRLLRKECGSCRLLSKPRSSSVPSLLLRVTAQRRLGSGPVARCPGQGSGSEAVQGQDCRRPETAHARGASLFWGSDVSPRPGTMVPQGPRPKQPERTSLGPVVPPSSSEVSRIRLRRPSLPVPGAFPLKNRLRAPVSRTQPNCQHPAMGKLAHLPKPLHPEMFSFQQHRGRLQAGARTRAWSGWVECGVSQEGKNRVQLERAGYTLWLRVCVEV